MGLSWPGVGIPKQCLAHRDLDRRVVPGLLPARSPGQVSKPGETNPPAPGSSRVPTMGRAPLSFVSHAQQSGRLRALVKHGGFSFFSAGREDFPVVSSKPRYFHLLNEPVSTMRTGNFSHLGLPLSSHTSLPLFKPCIETPQNKYHWLLLLKLESAEIPDKSLRGEKEDFPPSLA